MLNAPKHGIVDVDGTLYFCQYNAGLVEWNGSWIYVRFNGKVATGAYWITNTNGEMDQVLYDFGENGILTENKTHSPTRHRTLGVG